MLPHLGLVRPPPASQAAGDTSGPTPTPPRPQWIPAPAPSAMHASSNLSPTPTSARAPSSAADHDSSELPSSPSAVPISSLLADGFLLAPSRGSPSHEAMDISDCPEQPPVPCARAQLPPGLPLGSSCRLQRVPEAAILVSCRRPSSASAPISLRPAFVGLGGPPSLDPVSVFSSPRNWVPAQRPCSCSQAPLGSSKASSSVRGGSRPPGTPSVQTPASWLCSRPPGYPLPTLAFSFGQPRRLGLRSTAMPPKFDSTVPTASTDDGPNSSGRGTVPVLSAGSILRVSPRLFLVVRSSAVEGLPHLFPKGAPAKQSQPSTSFSAPRCS